MRLWLNRTGDISIREQLITQVVLGILSRELAPGHRLPSTRDLSRRFGIHANTASAAYRQLESDGWVETRHGSGVFVRTTRPETPLSPEMAVDQMIGDLAAKARKLGASDVLLKARLRRWLALEPPARWLVIEPDPELRRIVITEMEQALSLPVSGCSPEDCATPGMLEGSIPAVLPSKAAAVRKILAPGNELTTLQIHPVTTELQSHLERYMPAHSTDLVGIASRWADFQRIGQTMLVAAGLSPQCLLVRDATRPGWKRGLEAASAVVCDAALEHDLPPGCFPRLPPAGRAFNRRPPRPRRSCDVRLRTITTSTLPILSSSPERPPAQFPNIAGHETPRDSPARPRRCFRRHCPGIARQPLPRSPV